MIIKSPIVVLQKSADDTFALFSNMNNIAKILPEQVEVNNVDDDNISFTVKGMGSISLTVDQRVPNSLVVVVPSGKTPFQFKLNMLIDKQQEATTCEFNIDAELNFMMQMLAERPLQNLVNKMAEKVQEL